MIKKITSTIKKYKLIEPYDTIIIALSGGIDSMVLFDVLLKLKPIYHITIVIAHVNHNVREESIFEYQKIQELAKANDIDFHGMTLPKNIKENFHHYSHKKRYDFFQEVATNYQNTKIALAHHADDQIETILMRLTRGSTLKGYGGILPCSSYKDQTIIRPLIEVTKEDILTYQKEYNIFYMTDVSNNSLTYTRNRYRHNVVPLLKQENNNLHHQFQQFSNYLIESDKLIQSITTEYYQKQYKKNYLDLTDFNQQFYMIKISLLLMIINNVSNNTIEVSHTSLENIITICESSKPHLQYNLTKNFLIYKEYNKLYFNNKKKTNSFYLTIEEFGTYTLPNNDIIEITKNFSNDDCINSPFLLKLWYNDLDVFPIYIRTRQDGDKLQFNYGTKKLKDILIDRKIPLDKRNSLSIVTDKHNNIVWVPELQLKAKSNKTNNVIYVKYKEAKNNVKR